MSKRLEEVCLEKFLDASFPRSAWRGFEPLAATPAGFWSSWIFLTMKSQTWRDQISEIGRVCNPFLTLIPLRQAVQRIGYTTNIIRYNVSVAGRHTIYTTNIIRYNVSVAGRHTIYTTEDILDKCFTEFVFYGLPCLPSASFSNTVRKKSKESENKPRRKEGRCVCFWDGHSVDFFLPTAEITVWPFGKIGAHTG